MHQDGGERKQQRDVQGEEFVLLEIFACVVGAINRGHEMRVIENDCECIEGDGPAVRMRWRHPHGDTQKRGGPRAAAYEQVEPGTVNPRSGWLGWTAWRDGHSTGGSGYGFGLYQCGQAEFLTTASELGSRQRACTVQRA